VTDVDGTLAGRNEPISDEMALSLARILRFLANRNRKQKLEFCRALLAVAHPTAFTGSLDSADSEIEDRHRCPVCPLGRLILMELVRAEPRVWDTS
jgi:hypothetical protein